MSNNRRLLVGVHLEGIPGSTDTSKASGRVYFYDTGETPHSSTDYAWEVGLTELPSGVSTSINPMTGGWQLSSFTFTLSASNSIATYLLRTQKTGSTYLASDLDDSTTLVITSGDTPPDGSIVFSGDETIVLDGDLGGGLFASCTRGAYGSTATTHSEGDLLSEHPNYWVPRLVTLITHDVTDGTETIRWRGYLDRIETSESGATLRLACSEAYSRWRSARLNTSPVNLNAGGEVRQRGQGLFGNVSSDQITTATSGWIGVQTRGAVFPAQITSSGRVLLGGGQVGRERLATSLELESVPEGEVSVPWTEPVWECLVWDRIGDASSVISAFISPLTGSTAFHPVRIARELLSNVQLPDAWSLGLTHIDFTAFDDAVTDSPGLQIDQLILGANGEPFSPFEVAESLLRMAGYIPSITTDGVYSIKRFRTVSIRDVQSTSDDGGVSPYQDGPLHWRPPLSNGATEITAVTGQILDLPGHRGVVQASDGSQRAKLIRDREKVTYSFPFLRASRGEDVTVQLASTAALVHYDLPRLRVRVADTIETGISYDLGEYVALEDLGTLETAWWVDRNGARLSSADLSGRTDAIGMVIERGLDLQSMTYQITLLFLAYRTGAVARERAPSAVVDTWSSPTISTIASTFTDTFDASFFTVGDEVELWSRGGVQLSTSTAVVSAISGRDITISGSFGVTPASGNVVRISSSDTFFNDARYSVTGRPYVHLADANDEITHDSETVQADEYGGGIGGNL